MDWRPISLVPIYRKYTSALNVAKDFLRNMPWSDTGPLTLTRISCLRSVLTAMLWSQSGKLPNEVFKRILRRLVKFAIFGEPLQRNNAIVNHFVPVVNSSSVWFLIFDRFRYFKSHIFTRHLYKTYKCEDCHQTFNDQAQFHKHLWTHPMKKYRCEQCPMSFNASYKLENHQKTHEVIWFQIVLNYTCVTYSLSVYKKVVW